MYSRRKCVYNELLTLKCVYNELFILQTADEFYKEPLFYIMGHFSKFVAPGYQYIKSSTTDAELDTVAFQSVDATETVLIVLNRYAFQQD